MSTGLGLLIIAAALALVAAIIYGLWAGRTVKISLARPLSLDEDDPMADLLDQVVARLAAGGYRTLPEVANSVVLERRYFPGWTILLAVCVFPVGLLALLARGRHVVTVTCTETTLQVQGRGTTWARRVLSDALAAGAPETAPARGFRLTRVA